MSPPFWFEWLLARSWLVVGFLGQAIFTARFLVQWAASERRRDSVVPVAFWWLSLAGGLTLLSYALARRDPVFSVGQSLGIFIYVRNLMLVGKGRRRAQKRQRRVARIAAARAAAAAQPVTSPAISSGTDREGTAGAAA